jgi:hypothetical protein
MEDLHKCIEADAVLSPSEWLETFSVDALWYTVIHLVESSENVHQP